MDYFVEPRFHGLTLLLVTGTDGAMGLGTQHNPGNALLPQAGVADYSAAGFRQALIMGLTAEQQVQALRLARSCNGGYAPSSRRR